MCLSSVETAGLNNAMIGYYFMPTRVAKKEMLGLTTAVKTLKGHESLCTVEEE